MQILKFRVWDNLKKEWISNKHIWRMRTDERGIGEILPNAFYWKQHPDGHTIQQFTSLVDKNGVEIYEGDIVRFHEPTQLAPDLFLSTLYVFEFYNGSFLRPYIYQSLNGSKFSKLGESKLNPTGRARLENNAHFDLTKAEVIGNIFDTPFEIDL